MSVYYPEAAGKVGTVLSVERFGLWEPLAGWVFCYNLVMDDRTIGKDIGDRGESCQFYRKMTGTNENPKIVWTIGDALTLATPIYKARRHRPMNETESALNVLPLGTRVMVSNDVDRINDSNGNWTVKGIAGQPGIVVGYAPDGLYILLMDNGKGESWDDGIWGVARKYTIAHYPVVHPRLAWAARDALTPIPLYKGRRHVHPRNESTAYGNNRTPKGKFGVGDTVSSRGYERRNRTRIEVDFLGTVVGILAGMGYLVRFPSGTPTHCTEPYVRFIQNPPVWFDGKKWSHDPWPKGVVIAALLTRDASVMYPCRRRHR